MSKVIDSRANPGNIAPRNALAGSFKSSESLSLHRRVSSVRMTFAPSVVGGLSSDNFFLKLWQTRHSAFSWL